MTNWKNFKKNPPTKSCNICLKIGTSYDTYFFKRYTNHSWELCKCPITIDPARVPDHALYINLDEIK